MPEDGEELDASARVLRLVPRTNAFLPEGARFPTLEAFTPSSDEEHDALRTHKPVRVSVWDRSRTSIDQAVRLRGRRDVVPFELPVWKVVEVRQRLNVPQLKVVRDPDPTLEGPGADGHCGIEGIVKGDNIPNARKSLKELKLELVKCLNE